MKEGLVQLRALLRNQTGMSFAADKDEYLGRRVRERMEATGSVGIMAYLALLGSDGREQQELVNRITVNETSFFREVYQFRCLTESLLPEVLERKPQGAPIKLWSVPCATGEEPYSLAMHLLEHFAQVDDHCIDILGSDIDTAVLEQARAGVFSAAAVRRLPLALQRRYFEELPMLRGEARYRICDGLRRSVDFSRVNLVRTEEVRHQGPFHLIFCRNVLIYFDKEVQARVLANLQRALWPGGFLCLGHSESLAATTQAELGLVMRRFPSAIVYQRQGECR